MGWLAIFAAGVLEIAWIAGFKKIGIERPLLSLAVIGAMAVSLMLMLYAVRTVPVGTAYAVWTGLGAGGAALVGILLYNEPATALRLACIVAIIGGVIGLKLTAPA